MASKASKASRNAMAADNKKKGKSDLLSRGKPLAEPTESKAELSNSSYSEHFKQLASLSTITSAAIRKENETHRRLPKGPPHPHTQRAERELRPVLNQLHNKDANEGERSQAKKESDAPPNF